MFIKDETQSEEIAFDPALMKDETFKFDEESQQATAVSQTETAEEGAKTETASSSSEDKEQEVVEEQKVPYSRFKRVVEERDNAESSANLRIKALEDTLAELQKTRTETAKEDLPPEWIELYGDSDAAKKAWAIQQKREGQIYERAVKDSIDGLKKLQQEEREQQKSNEDATEDYLSSLQEALGDKKLTAKLEEDLLSIVDEFSPTDANGKYVALISPTKAIELYNLRSASKQKPVVKARAKVADLTSSSSEGEGESTHSTPYTQSWDGWRNEVNN